MHQLVVHAKQGKRCGIWKPLQVGASIDGKQGANRLPLTGRVQGRKLRPGTYRLVLTPQADGRSGPSAYAKFTILAPP